MTRPSLSTVATNEIAARLRAQAAALHAQGEEIDGLADVIEGRRPVQRLRDGDEAIVARLYSDIKPYKVAAATLRIGERRLRHFARAVGAEVVICGRKFVSISAVRKYLIGQIRPLSDADGVAASGDDRHALNEEG